MNRRIFYGALLLVLSWSCCILASGGVAKDMKTGDYGQSRCINVKTDLSRKGIYSSNAKADGITDDTNSVQAAVEYVKKIGGGTVYMPEGTYRFTTVTLVDGVSLIGDGPDKTVVRALSGTWGLIVMEGGDLMNMTLYGTTEQCSGDKWKVGKDGAGKGGTAMPVACIAIRKAPNGVVINNVQAFEARYDPLYVRDVNGLQVLNSKFDRAGRNICSIVGSTENFIFANCYFGSYWGLYHIDLEHNSGNYIKNGIFTNCVFDGSKAGGMQTQTWGNFLCFCGHAKLKNSNVSVFNCQFKDIYIRVQGVFPTVSFFNNTFDTPSAAFVRIPNNAVGEFRDAQVFGNKFYTGNKPNTDINYGVAFTGDSRFAGNFPEKTNEICLAKESKDHSWHEVHPIEQIAKLKPGEYDIKKEGDITVVHMPLAGHSIRFEDATVKDFKDTMEIHELSNDAPDIYLHIDQLIAIGNAGIQKLGKGTLEDFKTVPKTDYKKRYVGLAAGDVFAVKTKQGKYVVMEITAMDAGGEIKFKYKMID